MDAYRGKPYRANKVFDVHTNLSYKMIQIIIHLLQQLMLLPQSAELKKKMEKD